MPRTNSSASRAKSLGCIDRAYIVHETNIWEGGVGTTYSKRWLSRAAHSGEPPAVRQSCFCVNIALHEGGDLIYLLSESSTTLSLRVKAHKVYNTPIS